MRAPGSFFAYPPEILLRESAPVRALVVPERKKENGQPKGGMGGRHAATTQGF